MEHAEWNAVVLTYKSRHYAQPTHSSATTLLQLLRITRMQFKSTFAVAVYASIVFALGMFDSYRLLNFG